MIVHEHRPSASRFRRAVHRHAFAGRRQHPRQACHAPGPRRLRGAGPRDRRGVGRRWRAARGAGLPRFSAVLCWAHALLETCAAHRRVCSSAAKRDGDRETRGREASRGKGLHLPHVAAPDTYVNLVSLVVHVYLFVLATWFGFILHSGLNAVEMNVAASAEIARVARRRAPRGFLAMVSLWSRERPPERVSSLRAARPDVLRRPDRRVLLRVPRDSPTCCSRGGCHEDGRDALRAPPRKCSSAFVASSSAKPPRCWRARTSRPRRRRPSRCSGRAKRRRREGALFGFQHGVGEGFGRGGALGEVEHRALHPTRTAVTAQRENRHARTARLTVEASRDPEHVEDEEDAQENHCSPTN